MGVEREKKSQNGEKGGKEGMGRPSKTFAVISTEKKGHRTKAELERREKAEKSVLTGEKMRESARVKADEVAHRHWGRVRKLMAKIGRDDAMHERVINRYCLMLAECERLAGEVEEIEAKRAWLKDATDEGEIDGKDGAALDLGYLTARVKIEAEIDKKRGMMLQIEKENLMTVASGLRAVPKKEPAEEADPMDELLARRMAKE